MTHWLLLHLITVLKVFTGANRMTVKTKTAENKTKEFRQRRKGFTNLRVLEGESCVYFMMCLWKPIPERQKCFGNLYGGSQVLNFSWKLEY